MGTLRLGSAFLGFRGRMARFRVSLLGPLETAPEVKVVVVEVRHRPSMLIVLTSALRASLVKAMEKAVGSLPQCLNRGSWWDSLDPDSATTVPSPAV